jgi:hypothetical protein
MLSILIKGCFDIGRRNLVKKYIAKFVKWNSPYIYISLCLVFVLLIAWSSTIWLPKLVIPSISTFSVSNDLQQQFISQYAVNADINSGVTISVESFFDRPSDSPVKELVEFTVFNNSSEDIYFKNNGFGLRIFTVNDTIEEWQEIIPIIHPADIPTILLARTERVGPQTNNSYYLQYSDFVGKLPSKLRIFITGIGKITGKTYDAYIDLFINNN